MGSGRYVVKQFLNEISFIKTIDIGGIGHSVKGGHHTANTSHLVPLKNNGRLWPALKQILKCQTG
jgi:hypothetical protein